ncbi:GNAT family N-acetyltransferase [Saccharopolyspora elongata]|uniref:N-acetyltransferase n=1 Tax=Saccharopolyspora elongata TaxID=2530387 RepID=A0A4R4Y6C1_9PSEU|nr:GNAT family N-acetyltransferase [Saccharopolyspora elongata]TDD39826.1 N-acetyltransferase [Saccharopolyspora elongata]
MARQLVTDRLLLRPWRIEDAEAALDVYGNAEVTRWLSPIMETVPDIVAMRLLLRQWIAEDVRAIPPVGRWCIQRREDDRVIGGASLLPLPPGNQDLEVGWHVHPELWERGYTGEAMFALVRWAFEHEVDELFAVVRPDNVQAAETVRDNGMEWAGKTDKYFGQTVELYRLRPADLDRLAPRADLPPGYGAQ